MSLKYSKSLKVLILSLFLLFGFILTGNQAQAQKNNANLQISTTEYQLKNKVKRCPITFKKNERYYFRNMNVKVVKCKWEAGSTRLANGWWKTSLILTPVSTGRTKIYIENQDGRRVGALNISVNRKTDLQNLIKEKGSVLKAYKRAAYLLGITKRKHADFPSYYASGNRMILGLVQKNKAPYGYVKNTGNRVLTVFGVSIGEEYASANKKLNKISHESEMNLRDGSKTDGEYLYKIGQKGEFQMTVKNGKIVSYTYEGYFKG